MNCRLHLSQARVRVAQRGFTMVEIAIAQGVIGFALVAIIGILPTGLEVQRDNRSETIINQDAQFWMEALRSGAVNANELPQLVEWVDLIDRIALTTNRYVLGDGTGQTYVTASNIVGLLTWAAAGPERVVEARVTAISGAAAEKEMDQTERSKGIGFAYLLRVVIEPRSDIDLGNTNDVAIPFVAVEKALGDPAVFEDKDKVTTIEHFGYPNSTSLMEVRLAFLFPAIQEGRPPPRAQVFRSTVSRQVFSDPLGSAHFFLRP